MSLRFRVLGSGSSGNATLVEGHGTFLLIDAGLGPRSLAERLLSAGVDPASLAAVLLPKCPLCLAAYTSALGALGASVGRAGWLVEGIVCGAVVVSCALVFWLARRRHDGTTALASLAGGALVLLGRLAWHAPAVTILGALVLVGASLANSALCRVRRRPA